MLDNVKAAPKPRDTDEGWLGKPVRWWRDGRTFLVEVRNELRRVTWPSRKEVYATTIVVILTSIFFGLYLFILDFGFNSLVSWIFRRFGAS